MIDLASTLMQDVARSEDYEFLRSQLRLFSKICKVHTCSRQCPCFIVCVSCLASRHLSAFKIFLKTLSLVLKSLACKEL